MFRCLVQVLYFDFFFCLIFGLTLILVVIYNNYYYFLNISLSKLIKIRLSNFTIYIWDMQFRLNKDNVLFSNRPYQSMNSKYCELLHHIKSKIDTGQFSTACKCDRRNILRIGLFSFYSIHINQIYTSFYV